jgi:hypothetical protein
MEVKKETPKAAAKGTRGEHSMPAVGKYMVASRVAGGESCPVEAGEYAPYSHGSTVNMISGPVIPDSRLSRPCNDTTR